MMQRPYRARARQRVRCGLQQHGCCRFCILGLVVATELFV